MTDYRQLNIARKNYNNELYIDYITYLPIDYEGEFYINVLAYLKYKRDFEFISYDKEHICKDGRKRGRVKVKIKNIKA